MCTNIARGGLLLCLLFVLPLAGCREFDMLNALVPTGGYLRTVDLKYGEASRQALDVYRPRGAGDKSPVVVFVYGGYWMNGLKADYRFAAEALTSRGFIAVVPDYRLYPEVRFPVFVQDCAAAVRWVYDHIEEWGGDPSRIYIMGDSAGAHIAALLTLDNSYLEAVGLTRGAIRAAACMSGPYDFVPPEVSFGAFGMQPGDKPDPRIEPIHFVDGQQPPMLLQHGSADRIVDPKNAFRLADKIRQKGGEVRLLIYHNVGHIGTALSLAFPFRWRTSILDDATRYFRDH